MALLSIIIVNFNGETILKGCIDSIQKHPPSADYEIIVIDNNSQDNSIEILNQYNDITLLENKENVGFSKANNQGVKMANGRWIILLNNDTIVHEKTFDTILNYLELNPNIGALSPKLLNLDGSIQTQGSSLGAWRFKSSSPRKVPFVTGAAFVMSKSLYTEMGGLDEAFFFYNEDLDLCIRLRKAKKPIIYLPTSTITHIGGSSTKSRKTESIIEGYRGSLILCKKHSPWVYHIFRVILGIVCIINGIVGSLKQLAGFKNNEFEAMIQTLKIIITNNLNWTKK